MTVIKNPNWSEALARSWADSAWKERATLAAIEGRAQWLEPQTLPVKYAHYPYEKGGCFAAAIEASRRDPSLSVMCGFAFRDEVKDAGIRHFFNADGSGGVVDAALRLWAPPIGYLAGPMALQQSRAPLD